MIPSATTRAERIIARCREIAACSEVAGKTTRTFLSPPMHDVHILLRGWMESAGMSVWVDSAGNLRGLYPAASETRRLIIASHLDTVPNAGAFDGILGVVLGLAVAEELGGQQTPVAIEVIGFSEEEGVRFGKPYIGSLGVAGLLDEDMLDLRDMRNISVREAISSFGLDPAKLPDAVMSHNVFAYLEVHIEQGPVLENEDLQLGVVTAIVGQTRMRLRFRGQSNHAGTTPMHLRQDAMAAAAEWICAVEKHAYATPGLVATVGKVQTLPGASNVIAGEVLATLDVRHAEDAVRCLAADALLDAAMAAASSRGVQVAVIARSDESSVSTDSALSERLLDAARHAGSPPKQMPSGAGHDARIIAERLPIAMLFVRSPAGLSHHPDESVRPEDVEAALATVLSFVQTLRPVDIEKQITHTEAHA